MNMHQFTQKSLAAIQGAHAIALEYGHQQIEQAHLLMALVQDGEGLIPQLLTNMGLTLPSFQAAVQHEVVAICTPIFECTCWEAQRPKAAEPPALFINETATTQL